MGLSIGKTVKKVAKKSVDTVKNVAQSAGKVGKDSAKTNIGATAIGDMLAGKTNDPTKIAQESDNEKTEGANEQSLLEIIKQLLANQNNNDSSSKDSSGCGSNGGGCSGGSGGCNKTAAANSTANDAAAKQTAMKNLYIAEKNLEAAGGTNPFSTEGDNSNNKSQAKQIYEIAKANAQQAGVTDQEYAAYKQQMQQQEQATVTV